MELRWKWYRYQITVLTITSKRIRLQFSWTRKTHILSSTFSSDHPGEMSFDETDWLAYRQANLLFAEAVQKEVSNGDIVWVQGKISLILSFVSVRH